MTPAEAFKIESREGQPPVQVNAQLFAENPNALDEGDRLAGKVTQVTNSIQSALNRMQESAKDRWNMNDDEYRLAVYAMKNELERTVPSNFAKTYKRADSPEAAAWIITENILRQVNDYVYGKMEDVLINGQQAIVQKKARAEVVANVAASTSTFSVNREEAVAMFQKIDPNITSEEIQNLWAKFEEPRSDFDRGAVAARNPNKTTTREDADRAMRQ